MDRNDCIKHCRYYTGSAENTFSGNESFFGFGKRSGLSSQKSHIVAIVPLNLCI